MDKAQMIQRIYRDFTYHIPKEGQPEKYDTIRAAARTFALFLIENTPVSREQSLAITALEEVMFWTNASIARNE